MNRSNNIYGRLEREAQRRLVAERDQLQKDVETMEQAYLDEVATRIKAENEIDRLRARVAELEGWKLVPIEATMEMRKAGNDALRRIHQQMPDCCLHDKAFYVWEAMHTAAPAPVQEVK